MHRKMILAIAALAGLILASPARATVLAPGATGVLADPTVTAIGSTVGGPITVTNSGTTNNEFLDVSVTESVIKDAVTGHLDFVYQVTNKSDSTTVIEHVTVANYSNAITDVGYNIVLGDNAPVTMDRSSSFTKGAVITWDFPDGAAILPGGTSDLLIVKTNYDYSNFKGTVSVIDGQTVSLSGFEPLATPEPSTMALAGLGALGLIGYGLRRKARTA